MSAWIAQHFLNPALFWPGVALVSLPVIIHLINRLHYRRVRFAAMEFLLASEEKNRRRILIEQLFLLFLRILIVLLLMALIARMVLSATELTVFRGAKSHHLVLLDDSGSMRDRIGQTSAFDEAKAVIRKLVAEGANRPGTQRFTLLLASHPAEPFAGLSARDIDETLVDEVSSRLEDLQATHQAVDLHAAVAAARQRLSRDRDDLRHLHVVSDFRRRDWLDNKPLAAALRALDETGVAVNLVRTVATAHDNLAITELTGSVEVAAAGVPVSFQVTVANFGTRQARGVRVALAVDGRPVPKNLVFDTIEAGAEVRRSFEISFDTPGPHRLVASLEGDPLEQDNVRHLAAIVPTENPVLILDGTPGQEQGAYLADALAADKSVTGYAPFVAAPDYLRQTSLDGFLLIYLVNVPELPADDAAALEKYVSEGGGLAWFLGNAVRPAFYNETLYKQGQGLFPAPLATAPRDLDRDADALGGPDLLPSDHPVIGILKGSGNPFADLIFVNTYYPLDEQWLFESLPHSPRVSVVASLRNGQPLLLEHDYGKGRIVTCLTAAGPLLNPAGLPWTNWANGPAAPSFPVFQLDLARRIARRDRVLPRRTVGEPIRQVFSRAAFTDDVEFVSPDGHVTQIKALPAEATTSELTADPSTAVAPLTAAFRDTDAPGIYLVRMLSSTGQLQEQLFAYNVPAEEGRLALASDEQMIAAIGPVRHLTIQPPGAFDWIRSEAPGDEIRWAILVLLLCMIVCEQAMAYRLSYHPAAAGSRLVPAAR